ncbi:alginate lyase family protein [Terriglobus saanensis]|nr:alginate lyase family protein [Terriglobus saanensis]
MEDEAKKQIPPLRYGMTKKRCAPFFCGFIAKEWGLLALSVAVTAIAAPLRSPWDGHKIKQTNAPYTCGPILHLAPDLTTNSFYRLDDPTHSIVDPVRMAEYQRTADGVKAVGAAVVAAADAYRTTGSRIALRCATQQTLSLAKENALGGRMSSTQAMYVQGWEAGAIAIAYLKVREDAGLALADDKLIGSWLLRLGNATLGYYDGQRAKGDKGNNHLYWAGTELIAVGTVANDRAAFDWGIGTYEDGVKEIQPDGTLPREMSRGQRALHYHFYALAPLVLTAEFGEANGIDLYAYADGAIHRLVKACLAGVKDKDLFAKPAGASQEFPEVLTGDQIGWAPPYLRRFPNAELAKLAAAAPSLSVPYLGGLPPQ